MTETIFVCGDYDGDTLMTQKEIEHEYKAYRKYRFQETPGGRVLATARHVYKELARVKAENAELRAENERLRRFEPVDGPPEGDPEILAAGLAALDRADAEDASWEGAEDA